MKNTKKALLLSCLSMLICLSMLAGSTFAWFTDTATVSVNNIIAGNLDVQIVDGNGTEITEALEFVKADGAPTDEAVIFEPGAAYRTESFYIKNNGDLKLKYCIAATGALVSENKLVEALTISLCTVDGDEVTKKAITDLSSADTILDAEALSNELYIEVAMSTEAGNEYMGETIENLAITVLATQVEGEFDSFVNNYDQSATYPTFVNASSQTEINSAVTGADKTAPVVVQLDSGKYSFTEVAITDTDITFAGDESAVFDMSAQQNVNGVPDMTGTNITFDGVTIIWSDNNDGYQGIKNPERVVYKNCKIIGTQFMYSGADFINCTFETGNGYAVYTRASGDYTFTDCTFTTGGRAIMMYHDYAITASVTLNNCTFSDDGTYTSKDKAVVETGDDPTKASSFNITLNDCTITNGFETNNSTSALWGNKDNMPTDRLSVTIDTIKVY